MTAATLIADLTARGVELQASANMVRFRPVEKVTAADVEALRRYKGTILKLLRGEGHDVCSHTDPSRWSYFRDRYHRPGWQTVHCRLCGQFMGYQPRQLKE